MKSRNGEPADVHIEIADRGRAAIESIGEAYLRDLFVANSTLPNRTFEAARLERFTRAEFPRILLDPRRIDECPDIEHVEAAIEHLADVVRSSPDEFLGLFSTLDDPKAFRKRAKKLRLTQADFLEREGDALWPLVVLVAALVMNGSNAPGIRQGGGGGGTKCFEQMPGHSAVFCTKALGHSGDHRSGGWTPPRIW